MSKFFKELKRRNVFKETIAYLVVAWLLLQILAVVLPIWKAPDWILQIVTITLALGLPLWILFSWNYQITTTGIKKTDDNQVDQSQGSKINSRLNLVIMLAIVAVIVIIWIKPSIVSSKPIDNPALVILPFDNTDNNPENDWLANSLAKNIRDQLAKFDALNVLDFKASEDLLKSESSYEDIADKLDASFILKGRIENKNGKLTIETELIDSSEKLVWSDDFNNQSISDIDIQNSISKDVLKKLSIKISPEELTSLETKPTTNAEAYELLQRALIEAETRLPENLDGAIQILLKVIELDPNYAKAYAEIAHIKWLQATYGFVEEESVIGEINAYANKALSLNPDTSRAYQVLGSINLFGGNTEKGLENFAMALDIDPNDAEIHKVLDLVTKFDDTLKKLYHSKKALLLNPHHRIYIHNLFHNYLRYDMPLEAQELWNEKEYLYPDGNPKMIGHLKSILNKDWREYVKVVESDNDEYNDDQSNRFMAVVNWRIERNYSEQLKFARIAYEKADPPWYRWDIFHALINNQKFEEVENLIQEWDSPTDENKFLSENWKNYYLGKLNYAKQKFENALSYFSNIKESISANNTFSKYRGEIKLHKGIMLAKLGRMEDSYNIISSLKNDASGNMQKALIFAAMKEEDSMYNYINLSKDRYLYWRLSHKEFDPYRQQPRFIKLLEYYYLPVN